MTGNIVWRMYSTYYILIMDFSKKIDSSIYADNKLFFYGVYFIYDILTSRKFLFHCINSKYVVLILISFSWLVESTIISINLTRITLTTIKNEVLLRSKRRDCFRVKYEQ